MSNKNKNGAEFIKNLEKSRARNFLAVFRCTKCGRFFTMWKSHFYRGSNACRCGFLGVAYPRLYRIWGNMKTRCSNSKVPGYKDYGGRNIKVCKAWLVFENFLRWSLEHGYKDGLSLDRINNQRGYSPSNCRWADRYVQANNKRSNLFVNIDYEGQTLKRYCLEHNKSYSAAHSYKTSHGLAAVIARLEITPEVWNV